MTPFFLTQKNLVEPVSSRQISTAVRSIAIIVGIGVVIVVILFFLAFGTGLPHEFFKAAQPALLKAVQDEDMAQVEQLLAEGANPALADSWSGTPLMYAASKCNLAIVEKLLDAGASINERSRMDRTPLMWSAMYGCESAVRYLLDEGADKKAVDSKGMTAADLAKENGHAAISAYLGMRKGD